jgi:hypothetical protein
VVAVAIEPVRVDLSELSRADMVLAAIAHALGIAESTESPLALLVAEVLSGDANLVVLDNFSTSSAPPPRSPSSHSAARACGSSAALVTEPCHPSDASVRSSWRRSTTPTCRPRWRR